MVSYVFRCSHWAVLLEIEISWLHILRIYRDWVSTLYGRLAVWRRFPEFLLRVMG